MHTGASRLVLCKTDILKHRRLVEGLGGCGGFTQERRLVEKKRQVERELIPQWKSTDPVSAGLVLDPELGNSLRILKLIVEKNITDDKDDTEMCPSPWENKDLVVKLKSDNPNENPRTRFLPRG